jgi:clan AA aspartic protease (TIGR02281 family)
VPLALIPALLLVWLLCCPAAAQIYQWKDSRGTTYFADSLHAVPPEYRDQVQALDDRLPPPKPPAQIPLHRGDLGYLVDVTFNRSVAARLILDTGATSTVISRSLASRLGVAVRRDPPVLVKTAGGTVQAGVARVEDLEVGGRHVGPLDVIVHDAVPGMDGLLGMNFLGFFKVEIRSAIPALILSPP